MEEHYKDAIILTAILRSAKGLRWGSSSEVKYVKDGRDAVENLKLGLNYDTAQRAAQAGLVFSKKWVDTKFKQADMNKASSDTLSTTLAASRKLREQSRATITATKKIIEQSREAIEESHRVLDKAKRIPK